jgi:DNA-binding beta-propeller fold protein YncE
MAITPNGLQAYVLSPKSTDSPNGTNTIGVVNLETGKLGATISLTSAPWNIVFGPAGSDLAFVAATGSQGLLTLIMIDTLTATVIGDRVISQPGPVPGMPFAISPDGTRLYYPGPSGTGIDVFETPSLEMITTIAQPHTGSPQLLAVGNFLIASAGEYPSSELNVYSTPSDTLVAQLSVDVNSPFAAAPDVDTVYFVAYHPGAQVLETLDTLDLDPAIQLIQGFATPNGGDSIAVSPDGTQVVLENEILDLSTGGLTATLNTLSYQAAVAYSISGNSIYELNDRSSSIATIDQASGAVTGQILVGAGPVWISPTDSNDELVVTNDISNNITFLSISDGALLRSVPVQGPVLGNGSLLSGGAAANGFVYLASSEGFGYYEPGPGAWISLLTENGNDLTIVNFVQLNPAKTEVFMDAEYLSCPNCETQTYPSGSLFVYNALTGASITGMQLSPHGGMAFNPSGTNAYISTYSENAFIPSISVLDLQTNEITGGWLVSNAGFMWAMAVSPDGSTLYGLDAKNGTVRVFDISSEQQTGSFPASTTASWLALTPDGTTLYLADSASTSVTAINTASGAEMPIPVGSPSSFITILAN